MKHPDIDPEMPRVPRRGMGLRTWLGLAFILVAAIPALVFLLAWEFGLHSLGERESRERMTALAASMAQLTASFLADSGEDLRAVAATIAPIADRDIQSLRMEELRRLFPRFESIVLLDWEGSIAAMAPLDPDYLGLDLSRRPFFAAAIAADAAPGIKYSDAFLSWRSELATATLAAPLPAGGGVIAGDLDLRHLGDFLRAAAGIDEARVRIIDRTGIIIASRDDSEALQRVRMQGLPWDPGSPAPKEAFAYREGEEDFLGFAETTPGAGWTVLISLPEESVYRATPLMRRIILMTSLVSLILAALAGWSLARGIAGPVTELGQRARQLARDREVETAPSPSRIRELAALDGEFTLMATAVEERERELREALAQREILLKEVHHRVKNNLQVVASLISLQRGNATSEETQAALKVGSERIQALALVHEKLYRSRDLQSVELSDYLSDLVHGLSQAYQSSGLAISVGSRVVHTDLDTAIPLGLLVNELASNAFKHAAPAGATLFLVEIESTEGGILVRIGDNGPGYEESQARRRGSLGLSLIEALTRQLSASVKRLPGPGVSYEILIPPRNRG